MTDTSRALSVGDIIVFKGYDQEMPLADQMLNAGEEVIVINFSSDGSVAVQPTDKRHGGDTAWPEELTLPEGTHIPEVAIAAVPLAVKATTKVTKKSAIEKDPAKETVVSDKATAKAVQDKAKLDAKAAQAAEKEAKSLAKTLAKGAGQKITATAVPHEDDEENGELDSSPITNTKGVLDILANQDALVAAKSLALSADQSYFNLGGVLNHIKTVGAYEQAGYTGKRAFNDYVEKELGYGYRKAIELIGIYRNICRLGLSESRLIEIGWSKAKLLAKHATVENFDELIDIANANSREKLDVIIKNTFTTAGDGTAGTRIAKTKFNFTLFADQAETVSRALEAAKGLANNSDLNAALEYIAGEWLQTAEGMEVTLEQAVAHLQAKYNVEVEVKGHGHTGHHAEHVAAE